MRLRITLGCLLAVALFTPLASQAQDAVTRIKSQIGKYPPLKFEDSPSEEVGLFSKLSNAVFKPKGEGPFPAVVLVHTCGGIKDAHIRTHAKELLGEGYVVLVQDSFNPRGSQDCGPGNRNGLPIFVGVYDAYGALAHLGKFKFVDQSRIYQVGYSWGGFVATLLASGGLADVFESKARFRATVSNYSTCKFEGREFITKMSDRPVLMLMGERDDETPPASCFPWLQELKNAGKPVSWHVLPGATHGWDKVNQISSGYFYNEETTREATRRMLEFFRQNSGAPQ